MRNNFDLSARACDCARFRMCCPVSPRMFEVWIPTSYALSSSSRLKTIASACRSVRPLALLAIFVTAYFKECNSKSYGIFRKRENFNRISLVILVGLLYRLLVFLVGLLGRLTIVFLVSRSSLFRRIFIQYSLEVAVAGIGLNVIVATIAADRIYDKFVILIVNFSL